jgi:pimeloyl-ACP methyl ester carboxylesterase
MISAKSTNFKYLDRGKKHNMVLVPGWATDYRIFDHLDLDFNYLVPLDFSPFDFEEALLDTVKTVRTGKISLFGWSLGGFVAAEFASKHSNLVDELVLVSIRKSYPPKGLAEIEDYLKTNRKGYLYKFYSSCLPCADEFAQFKKTLLKHYCREMELDYLLKTLDYFKSAFISSDSLKNIEKIKIIHGQDDRIAPIEEAVEIKNGLANARFISIEDAGHMPFLKKDFSLCLS